MNIIVTSHNPIKLQAVKEACSQIYPHKHLKYICVNAPSGVSDQPMANEETLQWAQNRVAHAQQTNPDADLRIGLEWGCHDGPLWLESFARIVVIDKSWRQWQSKTASFFIPEIVARLVRSGIELRHADDQIFWQTNSKQSLWAVWLVTSGLVNRQKLYQMAVILAMAQITHEVYTR